MPLPPLLAAAVARIAAVDMGWNLAVLGTLVVPKIAVALACWQLHPFATARSCYISAVESQWSAGVSQNSDTEQNRVCYSGTGGSEWTRSRVAVCTAEVVIVAIRDIPAGC